MKSSLLTLVFAGFLSIANHAKAEEIGGIGIALQLNKETKEVGIQRVIANSPAARGGLKPGLIINSINDTPVTGKSLEECAKLIRGPAGTKVSLEVVDRKSHSTNRVELARAVITPEQAKAKLRDPAAALSIKEWIKGQPVDVTDGKRIYVVEFWATWCGPCRVSIPHLSKIQKEFRDKDVVVIGISDEEPSVVRPFVEKMGGKMDYIVACDDQRQTFTAYMAAYGQGGIPTAFIVGKDGNIQWFGHPMDGLDARLTKYTDEKE